MIISSKPNPDITNTPLSQNPTNTFPTPTINQIQNPNINSPPSNTNSIISTPSSSKETTPAEAEEEILDLDYRRPLSRRLPYQGKYFKAIRYVGTNKLEILVKNKADTELAKQEAQAWLIERGVDQDDKIVVSYDYR